MMPAGVDTNGDDGSGSDCAAGGDGASHETSGDGAFGAMCADGADRADRADQDPCGEDGPDRVARATPLVTSRGGVLI